MAKVHLVGGSGHTPKLGAWRGAVLRLSESCQDRVCMIDPLADGGQEASCKADLEWLVDNAW